MPLWHVFYATLGFNQETNNPMAVPEFALLSIDFWPVTVYSYTMTKREKLLAHAINNPKELSFGEFQTLLRQTGWIFDHQKGSHQIWHSPKRQRLPSQEGRSGKAKGYQVEQSLVQYEETKNEKV